MVDKGLNRPHNTYQEAGNGSRQEGIPMKLEQSAEWQTKSRGDNDSEYQIYHRLRR